MTSSDVPAVPEPRSRRTNYLGMTHVVLLDLAVSPIVEAFDGHPYLVGSVLRRSDYRDVDVRLILFDEDYDRRFPPGRDDTPALWSLLCLSISTWLQQQTGLPVDFQIQRMSEANEQYDGYRHALGISRLYAGGPS